MPGKVLIRETVNSEMTAVERRECRSHSPQKWKLLGLGEDMIEPARNPRLRSGGRENKAQPSLDILRSEIRALVFAPDVKSCY